MFRFAYSIISLTMMAMALGSCVKNGHDPEPKPTRVLLVYVGTDNDLAGYEQEKIEALRDGWSGKPTDRIIVYRDTRNADARLLEISNLSPGEQPREISTYNDDNSASPRTLSRVIADMLSMYPSADSYGLLVFSHASGWLPPGTLYNPDSYLIPLSPHLSRSVIMDDSNEMDISDFSEAIPDGVFDYIVFETCFMAGIEVAYELHDKAPLILASSAEIVHPGFASIYPTSTAQLFDTDITRFGQAAYGHTLTCGEGSPQRSATLSVIKTAQITALAAFVRDNCDFSKGVGTEGVQHFDRQNGYHLFFDFEDYYGRLLDTPEQRSQLARLVSDCIAWKAATDKFTPTQGGFTINCHSGFTTYIPQAAYPGLNEAYTRTGCGHKQLKRNERYKI